MTNPARQLHSIFGVWAKRVAPNAASLRGLASGAQFTDGDREHVEAMSLIGQLWGIIRLWESQGRDVAAYHRQIGGWARIVVNFPGNWNQAQQPSLISQARLDALAAFADTIDMLLPHFADERRASVLEYLDEVLAAVEADQDLPKDVAAYVAAVVRNARTCVEEYESRGPEAVDSAVQQLWGALKAAEGHAPSESREKWSSFLSGLGSFVNNAAAGYVSGMLLQLTQF